MKGLELFDSVGEDLRPQIRELIESCIASIVELYEETDGLYGERGKYNWRRKKDQAKKLGLIKEKE